MIRVQSPLTMFGYLSPVSFVLMVIIGGAVQPHYSHIRDTISALTAPLTPLSATLAIGFSLFHVSLVIFALAVAHDPRQTSYLVRYGAWTLAVSAAVGLLLYFFPEDAISGPITRTGLVHGGLTGVIATSSLLAMILIGRGLRRDPRQVGFARYTWWTVGGTLLSCAAAVSGMVQRWPIAGLLEMITVAIFMQWLVLLTWTLRNGSFALPPIRLFRFRPWYHHRPQKSWG